MKKSICTCVHIQGKGLIRKNYHLTLVFILLKYEIGWCQVGFIYIHTDIKRYIYFCS